MQKFAKQMYKQPFSYFLYITWRFVVTFMWVLHLLESCFYILCEFLHFVWIFTFLWSYQPPSQLDAGKAPSLYNHRCQPSSLTPLQFMFSPGFFYCVLFACFIHRKAIFLIETRSWPESYKSLSGVTPEPRLSFVPPPPPITKEKLNRRYSLDKGEIREWKVDKKNIWVSVALSECICGEDPMV